MTTEYASIVRAIAMSLVLATASDAVAQKYTLTRIAGNNGATIGDSAAIVYQDRLYYFERNGAGIGNIYRDNGVSAEFLRSVNFTSGVKLGPIIDGQLYYTKDGRQILVDDPLQQPIAAASSSIQLTSTLYVATINGKQLFNGVTSAGFRLYRREPQGLVLVDDGGTGVVSGPSNSVIFNNELIMGVNGPLGVELYRTDGYSIQLIADIRPGTSSSDPGDFGYLSGFRQVGQRLYFDAIGPNGREPYVYDGNTVNEVADIRPGGWNSDPNFMTSYKGSLVFSAFGPNGLEPYIVDSNGLRMLADINTESGTSSSIPNYFTEFNDWLYFEAAPNSSPDHLYRTNGVQVESTGVIGPNLIGFYSDPAKRPIYQSRFYFPAAGGMYSTDGNAFTLAPGATGTARTFQTFAGDLLVGFEKDVGTELYRWDGTTFSLLYDIYPGCGFDGGVCYQNSSGPNSFLQANGALYFLAYHPAHPGTQGLYRLNAQATNGDFNFDGTTDAADYVVWRARVGTTLAPNDYDLWRAHFGETVSAVGAGTAVPEPAAGGLISLTAAFVLLGHRRRKIFGIHFVDASAKAA